MMQIVEKHSKKSNTALIIAAILFSLIGALSSPTSTSATGMATANAFGQTTSSITIAGSANSVANVQIRQPYTLASTGANFPRLFFVNIQAPGHTINAFTITIGVSAGMTIAQMKHCGMNVAITNTWTCQDGSTPKTDTAVASTPYRITTPTPDGNWYKFAVSFAQTGLANVSVSVSTADLVPVVTNS